MAEHKIVVVGGVNVDIFGTSDEKLVLYDSNPGKSVISYGGVGRNIAENLCRLGNRVEMITVLGDDMYSRELISYSEDIGISFKNSMFIKNGHCSTYLCINNHGGEMVLAISDMGIYDYMSVEFISSKMPVLNSADLVILDTNIPDDVIRYIAENCKTPIAIDPVSTKKATKIKNMIGYFNTIKPNIYEAEILTDMVLKSEEDFSKAADYFMGQGVQRVFISLGERGVYYADAHDRGICKPVSGFRVVNVAGCGDTFTAASLLAGLNGSDIHGMAVAGECAAMICALSRGTISTQLTAQHLSDFISNYGM